MRRIAWVLLLLFAFAIPWEYSLDLGEPLGNVARIAGLLLLLAADSGRASSRPHAHAGRVLRGSRSRSISGSAVPISGPSIPPRPSRKSAPTSRR